MRKIKKVNDYLIVRFSDRDRKGRESLGRYGVIDPELYTGSIDIDLGSMQYDSAETIEEAIVQAQEQELAETKNENAFVEQGERRETIQEVLQHICDEVCKERAGRSQDDLDEICESCTVERILSAILPETDRRPRDTFRNVEKSNTETVKRVYTLGRKLEETSPTNDCRLYLNLYNMCRELDEQMDRVTGWARRTLKKELRRNYHDLEEMYLFNFAVGNYKSMLAAAEEQQAR